MKLQKIFKHHKNCIIRKPAYSYDILFYNQYRTKPLEDIIIQLLEDEFFTTSIYWSSSELYHAIEQYKQGLLQKKNAEKLLQTLKKYVIRTSTRGTPYGTFAGIGCFKLDQDSIERKDLRTARVDMLFFDDLKNHIESNEAIKPFLHYGICNTMYEMADNYRFTEPFIHHNNEVKYQLSSLEKTEYIDIIYKKSLEKKWHSIEEIHAMLPEGFSSEELYDFTNDLIQSGFLISEISQTKDFDSLFSIIKKIEEKHFSNNREYTLLFFKIKNCINIINNTNTGYLPLQEIEILKQEIQKLNLSTKNLFHIDLLKLDEDDIIYKNIYNQYSSDILHALEFVSSICRDESSVDAQLKEFSTFFRLKYENQRLPLLKVLDNEFGIGFPVEPSLGNMKDEEFIEDFLIAGETETPPAKKNKLCWLYDKIDQHPHEYNIEIKENDFAVNPEAYKNISENFSIMGSFHDGGFYLHNLGSANAALLGRFAYMDKDIYNTCKELRSNEQINNQEVIYADVRHIPQGKLGNVVRNESFSEYEICILSEPSEASKKQIMLNDLYISIEGSEIVLWSESLKKRVIPRISNAFNFNKSSNSIFKFLCALQYQNVRGLNFSIDYNNNFKRFFPRITYKNIILHRASWILRKSDIDKIKRSEAPLDRLKDYIERLQVKQYVCLIEGDNELFIDTQNNSYLELVLDEMKKKSQLVFSEWLKPISSLKYTDQIIINYQNLESEKFNSALEKPKCSKVNREFLPGSEWVYFKIYCSSNFSDILLKNAIKPFLDQLKEDNQIESYFFLRYVDPHYHIRLRIKITDKKSFTPIFSQFNELMETYIETESIWKVQLDTYHREIERYGSEFIKDSESIFYHDSELFLSCLDQDFFDSQEYNKLLSALKSVEGYLSVYQLDLNERYEFCKSMEEAFEKEFGKEQKKLLYTKYRTYANAIYEFMNSDILEKEMSQRNTAISQCSLNRNNLSSYIHMNINRWFSANQRSYEYMCYIFLKNYYNRLINTKIGRVDEGG